MNSPAFNYSASISFVILSSLGSSFLSNITHIKFTECEKVNSPAFNYRILVCSFRTRIIQSNNVLLETIVGSVHFMHSKLTTQWNAAVLNLRP